MPKTLARLFPIDVGMFKDSRLGSRIKLTKHIGVQTRCLYSINIDRELVGLSLTYFVGVSTSKGARKESQ